MKTFFEFLFVCSIASFVLSGCDDPKGASYVYGSAAVIPGGSDSNIDGKLAKSSSSQYYGECKYSGGEFSFTVAHAPKEDLGDSLVDDPMFVNFTGIKGGGDGGSPTLGVFDADDDEPKVGEQFEGSFKRASVAADDIYNFESGSGDCTVELFAEPLSGEVIREIQKDFEYYVRIRCVGMQSVTGTNTGTELMSVTIEFYFDNC